MDMLFNQLKNKKRNTVDDIVQMMKDAKIVDGTIVTEDRVKQLMAGVDNVADVQIDEFKKMLASLANEQKKNVAGYVQSLLSQGGSFLKDAAGSVVGAASRIISGRPTANKPDETEVDSGGSEQNSAEESYESEPESGSGSPDEYSSGSDDGSASSGKC